MFSFLKNHPFAVEAFFEYSLVITFAVPKDQLQTLIPCCLELDTFKDKWAFVAVALVQTRKLRPRGFPVFTGNDFFLVGYRVFVRYTNNGGKKLRGLYILKSETNKRIMAMMGNIFTHYNYSITDIKRNEEKTVKDVSSRRSGFVLKIDTAGEISLPLNSPFNTWNEARRFAGPLPFTFTYDSRKREVLIIEGVRQKWVPRPVKTMQCDFSFFQSLHIDKPVLANAFMVENIPYYWKKGKKEIWREREDHFKTS